MVGTNVIRPHGEEARAVRGAPAMLLMLRARAVSNHEGGRCAPTSSFETHRTVGKRRLCDAPQDEVGTSNRCGASVTEAARYITPCLAGTADCVNLCRSSPNYGEMSPIAFFRLSNGFGAAPCAGAIVV